LSSEPQIPPPTPRPLGVRLRRLTRTYLPWVTWVVAAAVTMWLGRNITGVGIAPGIAEIKQVVLSSPSAARILTEEVSPGDQVKAGQVLVTLDVSGIEAELAVAKAELERQKLEVNAEGASLRVGALETSERLAGDAERAALTVAQLEAAEQRDRSELTQLDEQIARQRRLVDEKLASADTLNQLKLRRAALAREVEEYARTLDKARAHSRAAAKRLAEWQSGKRDQKSSVDPSLEQRLAPYRAAVQAQKERVAQLEMMRAGLTIKAPFAGRVGQLLLRAGDTATAGAGVLTLVDENPRQVIAYVDQMWANRVRVGDQAQLTPSNRSGPRRSGHVLGVGASFSELPIRFRPVPTQPSFCREVYIQLDEIAEGPPLTGQTIDVTFRRAPQKTGAKVTAAWLFKRE